MLNLKPFRDKAAALPDLLNWAALIDEGVVLGKDGSLLAGFFFRGDDEAVASDSDRNYLTGLVNTYLAQFGGGWSIWVDASRIDSPGYPGSEKSYFPDPITAMIDAERRAMFEQDRAHFESEYALLIQYLPPLARDTRVQDFFYGADANRENTATGDRHLADFQKALDGLLSGLGDVLHMRRMGKVEVTLPEGGSYQSDELVNYLHYTLTGSSISLQLPPCPMYLDAWLGMQDFWPGDTPLLGDKHICCVAIEGFPSATWPGVLDVLDGVPLSYRWSSRFIFLEQYEAVAALKRYRRKWQQKMRGFWSQVFNTRKGLVNQDAVDMVQESEVALAEASSGLVAYGYYTPVVVLRGPDAKELERQAQLVRREVERRGFATRTETINAVEAWLGTLPGHAFANIRRPLINTQNLADLLPLSSAWAGERFNPCDFYPPESPPLMQAVTTGATPFRLNLHVGDVGHTLIFGPTGAGKSTLLAVLLAQARRYRSLPLPDGSTLPMTITAFDKGRSLFALCTATGGRHYDIGADTATVTVAPLAEIDSDSALLWAQEWVSTCFELQAGRPVTPGEAQEIHRALDLLRTAPKERRSLTNFVATVQDQGVRDALNHYTIGNGSMGHVLDGEADSVMVSSFTVFEIDELMKLGDKNAIPVLLYLFRRFEQSLKGQPAILSLDEAWVMLGHPVFRERLREWLKELRKKNCLVLLATQSLSDATTSGLLDVLVEQCPTKILLPNTEADLKGTDSHPGPADLYRVFGLNDKEIHLLKTSQYKRHYYLKSPLGRRRFELGLGPLALAFVGVSDKESIADIRRLQAQHGPDWPLAWLERKGVQYETYVH